MHAKSVNISKVAKERLKENVYIFVWQMCHLKQIIKRWRYLKIVVFIDIAYFLFIDMTYSFIVIINSFIHITNSSFISVKVSVYRSFFYRYRYLIYVRDLFVVIFISVENIIKPLLDFLHLPQSIKLYYHICFCFCVHKDDEYFTVP